jgi:hypothetical protein
VRIASAVACLAVLGVLAFSGWALLIALLIVLGAYARRSTMVPTPATR